MRHLTLAALVACSALPARGDDLAHDRRDLRRDRRALDDDRRDLARLERLHADLDQALARQDLRWVASIDDALQRELAVERRETAHEANQERQELRRDARERDARAYREDRRDYRAEAGIANRRGQIASELASLRGRYGPGELHRRRALLAELVRLARGELRGDVQELREDRRELREDRRPHQGPPGDERPRY